MSESRNSNVDTEDDLLQSQVAQQEILMKLFAVSTPLLFLYYGSFGKTLVFYAEVHGFNSQIQGRLTKKKPTIRKTACNFYFFFISKNVYTTFRREIG